VLFVLYDASVVLVVR